MFSGVIAGKIKCVWNKRIMKIIGVFWNPLLGAIILVSNTFWIVFNGISEKDYSPVCWLLTARSHLTLNRLLHVSICCSQVTNNLSSNVCSWYDVQSIHCQWGNSYAFRRVESERNECQFERSLIWVLPFITMGLIVGLMFPNNKEKHLIPLEANG